MIEWTVLASAEWTIVPGTEWGNQAPTASTSLLCEGATNPTNVTDTTPELSAIYNDPDSGDIANKYRIQVDDDPAFGSPIWDSGAAGTAMGNVTQGNRCSDISYAGSALSQGVKYYWRIRFWDDDGAEGAWSAGTDYFRLTILLAATALAASTTPSAALAVSRVMAATSLAVSTTPSVALVVNRVLAATALAASAVASAALAVSRVVAATALVVSLTPSATLGVNFPKTATALAVSATPSATLGVNFPKTATALAVSATPSAELEVSLILAATALAASTTPSAALAVSRVLAATALGASATPGAELAVSRVMAATALAASSTGSATLGVNFPKTATALAASTTPGAELAVSRGVVGTALAASATPDNVRLLRLEIFEAVVEAILTTGTATLPVSRVVAATALAASTTPNAVFGFRLSLAGTALAASATPSAALVVSRKMTATALAASTTPSATLLALSPTQPLKITVNGTDRTLSIPIDSIRLDSVITRRGSSASFVIENGGAMGLAELQEVIISNPAGTVRYFAGEIGKLEELQPGVRLDYNVDCLDYSLLLQRPEGLVNATYTAQADSAIILNALTTLGTCPDVEAVTYVETLDASIENLKFDYETPEAVLDKLAKMTGGDWYVDCGPGTGGKRAYLHYFDAATNLAPYNLSDAPDVITTFPYGGLKETTPAPVCNKVSVIGKNVTATRTRGAEGDYGRWIVGKLSDNNITTTAQAEQYGDDFLERMAANKTYTCTVRQPGLRAGQTIQLTNALRGITAQAFTITKVSTTFEGGGYAKYQIEFGKYRPSLADLIAPAAKDSGEGSGKNAPVDHGHSGGADGPAIDPAGLPYATPAVVLGTAAAAGAANTVIRSDSTIIAFDVTVPTTIQPDDAAAVGSAAYAARRDHKHAIVAATPVAVGAANAEGDSTSFARANHVHLGGTSTHTHDVTGNTSAGAAHTHTISGTSAAGSAHGHAVGTLAAATENLHDHSISGATSAGAAHTHTISGTSAAGAAHTHAMSGTSAAGAAHTHAMSGTSAAGSSHSHPVTGSTDTETAHTHALGCTGTNSGTQTSAPGVWVYYQTGNSSGPDIHHVHSNVQSTESTSLVSGHQHTYTYTAGITGNDAWPPDHPDGHVHTYFQVANSGASHVVSSTAIGDHTHTYDKANTPTGGGSTHSHAYGSLATTAESTHTHGIGSIVAANESTHTHGIGSIVAANESTHTHGIGSIVAANESTHKHAQGSLVTAGGSAHTHGLSGSTANESTHTHGIGSIVAANESTHTHTADGTLATGQPV